MINPCPFCAHRIDYPCPFCAHRIDSEVYDYVRSRDDRIHVRCPHCTETVVIDYDGMLIDPDAAANALMDVDDDLRRYGPANSASDYGE